MTITNGPSHLDQAIDHACTMVTAAYRTILRREPDPAGMATYMALLGEEPFSRLEELLRVLLASTEAKQHLLLSLTAVQSLADTRTVDGRDIAHVVSLGSRCTVANHLQSIGLRTSSLPFDWIFSTSEIVVQCLEDDFELFLRQDQYRQISVQDRKIKQFNLCDHITFRDCFGQDAMFNHRDPTLPQDYDYFVRCVGRFRKIVASDGPVLFVLVTDNHPDAEAAYVRLSGMLDKTCRSAVALLFVQVRNEAARGPLPWIRAQRVDGDHELMLFDAVGALGGTSFASAVDEIALEALIRRYRFAATAFSARSVKE